MSKYLYLYKNIRYMLKEVKKYYVINEKYLR